MSIHDAVQYVGRFCEVTTRHETFFGDFARFSALRFFVRPRWPTGADPVVVDVQEITAIEPFPEPCR